MQAAWQKVFPGGEVGPVKPESTQTGEIHVIRGRPRHASDIAMLINRLNPDKPPTSPEDIMAAFGEKAFLLLQYNSQLMGMVGWQVENLVARATDLYIDPSLPIGQTLTTLITEVEKASRDLQCEVSLLFLPPNLARHEAVWKNLGYEQRMPDKLGVQAWQEAAIESMTKGSSLFFKQLRVDRILRPI